MTAHTQARELARNILGDLQGRSLEIGMLERAIRKANCATTENQQVKAYTELQELITKISRLC